MIRNTLLGESGKLFLVIGHKISVCETQQVTNYLVCTQFTTLYQGSGAIRAFSHNADDRNNQNTLDLSD